MKKWLEVLSVLLIGICFPDFIYTQQCINYNRSDYHHWIDADNDCQSTRNEVLKAESVIPVSFKTNSKCKVASGKWIDPYTGRTFNNPGQLDIDHVVPKCQIPWCTVFRAESSSTGCYWYLSDPCGTIPTVAELTEQSGPA